MIVDRSAPPHKLDEQPDSEHTRDHTEGHGDPVPTITRRTGVAKVLPSGRASLGVSTIFLMPILQAGHIL
jgi:hypothetical protein